jgi:putative DNA primase/helicase
LGWRVLPLDRRSKKPVLRAWPERATTDREIIEEWWTGAGGAFAGCTVGVATGRGSGIWILDVDQHGGSSNEAGPNGFDTLRELEARYEPLPETFTVRTPSGGEHRWFQYPAEGEVVTKPNTLGPGLDTRGHGGQAVAPGSWTPAGEYRVTSAGEVELAETPRWLAKLVERRVGIGWAGGWSDEEQVGGGREDWLAEAAGLGDGDQEWFLFRFMSSLRARAVSPEEMQRLGWEAARRFQVYDSAEPWTEAHVREKVTSACRYPAGTSDARPVIVLVTDEPTQERQEPTMTVPAPASEPDLHTVVRDVELPTTGGSPENPWRNTDRANGIEVARFLDGKAFWTPENGWFVFDGKRWAPDAELVRLLLVGEYTDQLRQQVTSGQHAGRDEGEVLMARANRIESSSGLNGALDFAKAYVAVGVTRLDGNPWLLNCPNGTLNLRTGELLGHDPRHLITRCTPTPYDPDAADATWDRVRYEALEGDEHRLRLLARFAGYTLTGRTTEKCMLVISGPTNTAKSTITEPLYRALGAVHDGGYATTWDADVVQLDAKVNRAEKLNKVRGARMVLVGELAKGSRMADNFVKQFTGGDTMDARGLYKDSYSYRPQAKLWMATNYVPGSADKALHERLLILPFQHTPVKRDPAIKAHLEDSEEAQRAMLAWAVRGCLWWQQESSLGDTPWLDEAKAEYALESDPVLSFVHDRLDVVEGYADSSYTDDVWSSYQLWGVEHVRNPLRRRAFEAAMKEHGFKKARGSYNKGGFKWLGFKIQ